MKYRGYTIKPVGRGRRCAAFAPGTGKKIHWPDALTDVSSCQRQVDYHIREILNDPTWYDAKDVAAVKKAISASNRRKRRR